LGRHDYFRKVSQANRGNRRWAQKNSEQLSEQALVIYRAMYEQISAINKIREELKRVYVGRGHVRENKEEAALWRPLHRHAAGQMSSRPPFTPEPQKRDGQSLFENRIASEATAGSRQSNSPDRCNYVTATARPVARLKEL
jgi:hypothetical protein